MKQYLQPIFEMMSFDPNEDILTTSNTLLNFDHNDNSEHVDSITW